MSQEHDPIERLRAADPVPPGTTFDPTDARARAIRDEVFSMTMTDQTPTTPTTPADQPAPSPWWRRPNVLAAAAALVLVAGIAAIGLTGGDDGGDADQDLAALPTDDGADTGDVPADDLFPGGEPTDGVAPGGDGTELTSCVATFSPETVVEREYAFEGTIRAVDEAGNATFEVHRWFSGGEGAEITLDASDVQNGLLAPDVAFEPGVRVLVAGDGGFVWGCGFLQLADEFNVPVWEDAFTG